MPINELAVHLFLYKKRREVTLSRQRYGGYFFRKGSFLIYYADFQVCVSGLAKIQVKAKRILLKQKDWYSFNQVKVNSPEHRSVLYERILNEYT